MALTKFIHILRPKNLVIVALSQVLIYCVYMMPALGEDNITLDGSLWWLFVIDTILIAGGGYIINDFYDQKADRINKPDKSYISDEGLSSFGVLIYYSVVVMTGFMIAFYIANQIGEMHLLIIYPIAVLLLFLYSYSWKKLPLLGNLVVSVFCAFVPGIIWYAETDRLEVLASTNTTLYFKLVFLFSTYIAFGFFITFVREIIKDVEDEEGDRLAGYKTFPIKAGVENAKMLAIGLAILMMIIIIFLTIVHYQVGYSYIWIGILFLLSFSTIRTIQKIIKSKEKKDFYAISKMLKYYMIISLFIFLCIPFIIDFF